MRAPPAAKTRRSVDDIAEDICRFCGGRRPGVLAIIKREIEHLIKLDKWLPPKLFNSKQVVEDAKLAEEAAALLQKRLRKLSRNAPAGTALSALNRACPARVHCGPCFFSGRRGPLGKVRCVLRLGGFEPLGRYCKRAIYMGILATIPRKSCYGTTLGQWKCHSREAA
jgi:hypothetical protein